MTIAEWLDAAILVWLIGSWIYEGHLRKVRVVVVCERCGKPVDLACESVSVPRRKHA